ncbi:ArsR family transcriptional regulator [Chloroflexota bacterium]
MAKLTVEDLELEQDLTPMQETLEQVKTTLRQHFEIKDWQGVDIILAVAVAHWFSGEMLWLRLIGPSRSGKTELLRVIVEHPDCAEIEMLTPAAFRGGFKKGQKLLDRIKGKLVITKDIASILTSRKDMRNEIFGVLRGIKDGRLTSDFGSDEGHLVQEARFDWIIAATTSGIEQQRQLDSLLGQRFIDLRWQPGNREKMAFRAATNNPNLEHIREELIVDVSSLLFRAAEVSKNEQYTLGESELRWVAKVADTVAVLRTSVMQDRQGNILNLPEPEVGTELAQGFSRVVRGLLCLGFNDWRPYISRIAWDSVPSLREKILRSLENNPQTVDELEASTGIPKRTIYYHLEHLELLKVVKDSNKIKEVIIALP